MDGYSKKFALGYNSIESRYWSILSNDISTDLLENCKNCPQSSMLLWYIVMQGMKPRRSSGIGLDDFVFSDGDLKSNRIRYNTHNKVINNMNNGMSITQSVDKLFNGSIDDNMKIYLYDYRHNGFNSLTLVFAHYDGDELVYISHNGMDNLNYDFNTNVFYINFNGANIYENSFIIIEQFNGDKSYFYVTDAHLKCILDLPDMIKSIQQFSPPLSEISKFKKMLGSGKLQLFERLISDYAYSR